MTKNKFVATVLATTVIAGGLGTVTGFVIGEPSSQCLNLARSAERMSDAYNSEDQVAFAVEEANARTFRGSCS